MTNRRCSHLPNYSNICCALHMNLPSGHGLNCTKWVTITLWINTLTANILVFNNAWTNPLLSCLWCIARCKNRPIRENAHSSTSTYTHVCKSFSERAPHDAVDDGVDARIEGRQNGQPAQHADIHQIPYPSAHQQQWDIQWGPANSEDGCDCQTGEN